MSHPYRGTIFVELKTNKGVVSENQWDWINSLQDSGEEVHVWRPCHLEKISERLSCNPNDPLFPGDAGYVEPEWKIADPQP
jgi:hypothetical protein